jgi:transcriptional regulator with XRE-family HTH domain
MPIKKTPNPVDVRVGSRVRMARIEASMSQEKLAGGLGLTFQQVQKYEKGTNRIGSSRLQQISQIVGKPVSWFFDEKNTANQASADLCTRLLTAPGGLELAQSYLAIPNAGRIALRHVAAELAAAHAN